jgi:hypothetical protein
MIAILMQAFVALQHALSQVRSAQIEVRTVFAGSLQSAAGTDVRVSARRLNSRFLQD